MYLKKIITLTQNLAGNFSYLMVLVSNFYVKNFKLYGYFCETMKRYFASAR